MNRIRELRVEKGITQVKFAQMLSTSQANISGWELEKWEPDKNALKKMSEIFGCSIDFILGNDKEIEFHQKNLPMEKLKQLRLEKHLTQSDMAKMLDITVSAYGNYELGQREPNLETLIKLADYFQVSVDYLIGHDNAIMKRPYSEIAENFIKEFQELFSEKAFRDMAKLYQVMNDEQKAYILAYIAGYLSRGGINTINIVGY